MLVINIITKTITRIIKTNALLSTNEISKTEYNMNNFINTIKIS